MIPIIAHGSVETNDMDYDE